MPAVKNFSEIELRKNFSYLLETDKEIKTGKKPEKLGLELLTVNICRKGRL